MKRRGHYVILGSTSNCSANEINSGVSDLNVVHIVQGRIGCSDVGLDIECGDRSFNFTIMDIEGSEVDAILASHGSACIVSALSVESFK